MMAPQSRPQQADTETGTVLRIPYALTESGARVRPDDGERGVRYLCPECHARVVLRRGEMKVPHFAHYTTPESCRLVGEGWVHVAAKQAVFATVMECVEVGQPQIRLLHACEVCAAEKWQMLPPRVHEARLECQLTSGRILDIGLFDVEGCLLAGIEIRHSHAVDHGKARDLQGTPWIELSAVDALQCPETWRPVA